MKQIFYFTVLLLVCSSCKTPQYIPVESVKTEYRHTATTDSVFLRDSIFVKEKGDTLILEKYRYLYRYNTVRDSFLIRDTLRVPYPVEIVKQVKKPLSEWQNFQVWCGRIALVFLLFVIVYFVLKLKKRLF